MPDDDPSEVTIRGTLHGDAYTIFVGLPGQPPEVEGGEAVDRRRIRWALAHSPRHSHELDSPAWVAEALAEHLPEFKVTHRAPSPEPEDLPPGAIP